jgi:hypothetical protein
MKLIIGKIAAVVTDDTVVINRGSADGVTRGMEFTVQLDVPKITDPDNPERTLSGVFYEKARLTVGQIFDNFSFASLSPKAQSFSLGIMKSVYPDTDHPLVTRSDWQVRVGDVVRQVVKSTRRKEEKEKAKHEKLGEDEASLDENADSSGNQK